MNCPNCQTVNPAGARFCMNCGSALPLICSNCGAELPAEAQFCLRCGHRVAGPQPAPSPIGVSLPPDPRPAPATDNRLQQYIPRELLDKLESARASGHMQGERRIVTMLFCDVQGSTAAAEKMDPEEWTEIMNGAFERLIVPVYRYEGTLARLLGDAILAFFGAPIAHEDDPQRAILAGLEIIRAIGPYREQIRNRWGFDFNVRVGVNTGLVVVGEVGTDLRVEYTAMGDAVNLAARMEQTARPGSVQIAENSYRLVAPLFDFEELGGIEVKGKSELVRAYRVLGPRAQPGRLRGIEGLESPLIGRDGEMSVLLAAADDLRQGRGRIVSVMGEAGLGKSRLVTEVRHALAADGLLPSARTDSNGSIDGASPADLGWYEGRSLSYETTTPYAPFISLFNGLCALQPEQTDGERYERVRGLVAEAAPRRVEEIAPFIATMLGIDLTGEEFERVRYLEPPQLRDRISQATCDLVEGMASLRPLVLVFEDVHWIDPISLDLLEQLMPLTDRASLMLIALFRPLRQDPSWRFHEVASRDYSHRYTSIPLDPLDEKSSRTLVAHLLEIEDLPEKVRSLILAKAEGNPFFVEEVIRSLLDARLVIREDSHWRATREIEDIAVPDTLAGVITARLDRLNEESKHVAQTASVIGREYRFEELASVHEERTDLDEALTDLQRRELIREKSRVPQRVYMFKHALTQETAYSSLLLSRRRELHRRVAECLEQLDPERVNEIARHFLEAREHNRALPYLIEAGDRAANAYATSVAIDFYTGALKVLETVEDLALARRAYEGLGRAQSFSNDTQGAAETYRRMLHTAQDHGDAPMRVSAMNKLAFVLGVRLGEFAEAVQYLDDSERLAREHQDIAGLAELHMIQCNFCTVQADFEGAVDHLSEAARIGREINEPEPRLYGLTHIANTQTFMARFDDAWGTAQEALQTARDLGHRQWIAENLAFAIATYHLRNGDLGEARRAAEEAVTIAGQIGASNAEASASLMLGRVAFLRGEYERALVHYQRALRGAAAAGTPWASAALSCAVGSVYLEISQEDLAQIGQYQTSALELMQQPGGTVLGASAWAELGWCVMTLGDLEKASEYFQQGLTVPTATVYLERPKLLVGFAFLQLAWNNVNDAALLIEEASQFVQERAMKHYYPLVAIAEARLSTARGEMEQALKSLVEAEGFAQSMGMLPLVLQARVEAAKLLASSGRAVEARAKGDQARAMIDEIAALFEDDEMRKKYIDGAMLKLA